MLLSFGFEISHKVGLPPKYTLNKEKIFEYDEDIIENTIYYKYSFIYNEGICQIVDDKFLVLK